jgi:hypothetical protein
VDSVRICEFLYFRFCRDLWSLIAQWIQLWAFLFSARWILPDFVSVLRTLDSAGLCERFSARWILWRFVSVTPLGGFCRDLWAFPRTMDSAGLHKYKKCHQVEFIERGTRRNETRWRWNAKIMYWMEIVICYGKGWKFLLLQITMKSFFPRFVSNWLWVIHVPHTYLMMNIN